MSTGKSITLLHLSDLQFGPHHRFDAGAGLGTLLDRLARDLEELRDKDNLRPDLALITGDLTEYGRPSQFEQFHDFARGLAKATGLPHRRIVLVPGNHDINRGLSEAYFRECAEYERAPTPPFWPKLRFYAEFFARFYEGEAELQFTEAEPWTFFAYPELRTVVAGLNSTLADSHRAEDHYGWIGEKQLRAFAEKLRPYREQGFLRIGAVHHDLLSAPTGNARAEEDRRDARQVLAPYLNLLFHGHTHEEQLVWNSPELPVLCIGSGGVKAGERPEEVPNQYQMVRIAADGFTRYCRAYAPDKKRWLGDLRADPDGRSWTIHQTVRFTQADAALSGEGTPVVAPRAAALSEKLERYRQHVARTYRRKTLVDLAGLGEDRDFPGGLDLLDIFVMPSVVREGRIQRKRARPAPYGELSLPMEPQTPPEGEIEARPAELESPPEPAEEALTDASRSWILLLGAPGSGKTTLTRWLALKLCVAGETPPGLSDLIPVRIELRRFDLQHRARTAEGRSYDFFDCFAEELREYSQDFDAESLRSLAKGGRLVWLFDGLDEVSDPRARLRYTEMIAGIKTTYGGRGIITSRIVGSGEARALLQDFDVPTYRLLDFDEEQVQAFFDRWHALAFPGAPEIARHRRERLERTLRESTAVRDLCKNPLLLTMLALLNRGAELPTRRHALYARAVEWMVHQWEANKASTGEAPRHFVFEDKLQFLRELAWEMMTTLPNGSGNVVREADLLAFATRFRQQTRKEPVATTERVTARLIGELSERHHILTFLGGDTYGFAHRAFLEYLAAAEAVGRFRNLADMVQIFREHWHLPAWNDVLPLIAGMLAAERPEHVIEVLQGVLRALVVNKSVFMSFTAFSIRCLTEAGRLEQEPLRTFALRLTDLIRQAPERIHLGGNQGLLPALRLTGELWPGAPALQTWALDPGPNERREESLSNVYALALATTTRADRLSVLETLLRQAIDAPALSSAILEAARHGPWTSKEAAQLQELATEKGERIEAAVARCLLLSGISTAVNTLHALMSSAADLEARFEATLSLLQWGKARRAEAALAMLPLVESSKGKGMKIALRELVDAFDEHPSIREHALNWLSSPDEDLRMNVAAEVARRDVPEALHLLEADVRNRTAHRAFNALRALQSAAKKSRAAQKVLSRALVDRRSLHPYILIELCAWWADRGSPGNAAHVLEETERATPDEELKIRIGSALIKRSIAVARGYQILKRLAFDGSTRQVREMAVVHMGATEEFSEIRRTVDEDLSELLRSSTDKEVRLRAALSLARRDHKEAREALIQFSVTSPSEQIRLEAALNIQSFRRVEADLALGELLRGTSSERTRFRAAQALEDRAILNGLAESAQDSSIRAQASEHLTLLHLRDALLRVGKKRRGWVSLSGERAGVIEETALGSRFTYDPAWLARPDAKPISLTLPLRALPYESEGLHPFFENLLPEGWLLALTRKKLGIPENDAFGLLLATCGDCIGAVEITPAEDEEAA